MAQGSVRSKGTVKWFKVTKGYGFITPDDGSEDLFVHQTSIKSEGLRSLAPGEAVEFVVSKGDDGRAFAVDVTGPDGANVSGWDGRGGGGGGSLEEEVTAVVEEAGGVAEASEGEAAPVEEEAAAGHFARECPNVK